MTRSTWKPDILNATLLKTCLINKKQKIKTPLYLMDKASIIYPLFRQKIIYVYTGRRYIPLRISANQIGHKFGEFIYTRLYRMKKKKGKKIRKK